MGFFLVGCGVAMQVRSGLGMNPLGVLVTGAADITGASVAVSNGACAGTLLAAAWLLGRPPGAAALTDILLGSVALALAMAAIPDMSGVAAAALAVFATPVLAAGVVLYLRPRAGRCRVGRPPPRRHRPRRTARPDMDRVPPDGGGGNVDGRPGRSSYPVPHRRRRPARRFRHGVVSHRVAASECRILDGTA